MYRNFVTSQSQHAPVERDHEGNTEPLEPHRWAIFILPEDGTGCNAEGFHNEGEGVGNGQPGEEAFVFVRAINSIKNEAVENKEKTVCSQLGDGEDGWQAVGQGSAGEGENEEVREVASKDASLDWTFISDIAV